MFAPHRGGEQEAVVEDDADLATQRSPCDVADVVTVETHRSVAHVVETGDKGQDSRLARPGRADESHGFARVYAKVEVGQGLAAVGVGELDVVEVDPAREGRQLLRRRRVGDGGLEVEQFKDPLDAGPGLLSRREDARQHPRRGDELGQVGGKGEERADRDPVVEREPAAERQDGDLSERRDGLQQRLVTRLQPDCSQV